MVKVAREAVAQIADFTTNEQQLLARTRGPEAHTHSSAPLVNLVEKGPRIEFVTSAAGVECAQR